MTRQELENNPDYYLLTQEDKFDTKTYVVYKEQHPNSEVVFCSWSGNISNHYYSCIFYKKRKTTLKGNPIIKKEI